MMTYECALAKIRDLKRDITRSLRNELADIESALPELAAAIRTEGVPAIRYRLNERYNAMIHRSVEIELALASSDALV